ncbi:hypothetical protein HYFRA_00008871 [Hymenoscyphus fraxineus]|uniref:Uncharacterized protein n=1 Tax=Hymenoscyphus fraxineus TaxID=746836 RepID=A0A9N9PUA7_9HELO|nr:hypothetical protein HYFRA_00008871 [Hymenoscyphus fraxineus]
MGLLSANIFLLLTVFTNSFPHFASAAPPFFRKTQFDAEAFSLRDLILPGEQAGDKNPIARKGDGYSLSALTDFKRLEAKGVRWEYAHLRPAPEPAPPVVLPVLRPPPNSLNPIPKEPDPIKTPSQPNTWKPISENDIPPGFYDTTVPPVHSSGLGELPKAMEFYAEKGRKQLNIYEEIVRSNKKDTETVLTKEDLVKHRKDSAFIDVTKSAEYEVYEIENWIDESFAYLPKLYKSEEIGIGLNRVPVLTTTTVYTEDTMGLICRATYADDGQFIIYQHAYKENDGVGEIPINEIQMQNFFAASKENAKNFRAAFFENIQNKEFWAITRENYNDMKQPYTKALTFERGTPQFDRYMGSPNIWSKFWGFGNHHNALGKPIPMRIIITPTQVPNSFGLGAAIVFKQG